MKTRPFCISVAKQLFTVQVLSAEQFDLELRIADQLARNFGGEFRRHRGRRLVDVITPDDKPFVPRPHHANETHADPANIGAGLHDPIEDARTVGDVFRKIRPEEDVHRPADAHLALEWEPQVLSH